MKFPLPKNLFPPLELTEFQEQQYEQLASALVKATLAEYDEFVTQDRKRVDARCWKTVCAQDGLTIYRERDVIKEHQAPARATLALYRSTFLTTSSRPSHNTSRSGLLTSDTISFCSGRSFVPLSPKKGGDLDIEDSSRTANYDSYSSGDVLEVPRITTAAFSRTKDSSNSSGLPRLLAVGTLRGSLDDVMYGVVSPDAPSVRLRSSYLGEHITDCAVLRAIKSPSSTDPFRFLGIKWFVRAKHRGAARILLPRDFVVLEFSGVMMRPDNSRVGFHLMHSIEISSCRQLHEHRILRAKLSSCYIFENTRSNCVQVFMTASVDPSGYVLTRMAVRSAATALSKCWKSISCAHDKKLAFCLQNERPSTMGGIISSRGSPASATRIARGGLAMLAPVNESDSAEIGLVPQRSNYSSSANRRQCGVCREKLGLLFKSVSCQLCSEAICSRCRIVRKLSCDTLSSQVTQASINFCKKCVASVSDESAIEIARQEVWVRTRSRARTSSSLVPTSSSHSFTAEKSTYAAVMLGQSSDPVSRGSSTSSSLGFSIAPQSLSQGRSTHSEESFMGYSVGPSTSTQVSTLVKRPNSSDEVSIQSSLPATSISTDSFLSDAQMSEALWRSNLHIGRSSRKAKTVVAAKEKTLKGEEPVVLDRRLTTTLRSLRHLDYVLSVDEQDIEVDLEKDDLESEKDNESESGDEGETRLSYASSVAVLDNDYTVCVTPTSNLPESQRECPIVQVEADEEREEVAEVEQNRVEMAAKDEHESDMEEKAESLEADHREGQQLDSEMSKRLIKFEDKNAVATANVDRDDTQLCSAVLDDAPASDSTYQRQLFQQMQDLHNVVESTYQVAQANTEAAIKGRDSGPVSKPLPDSKTEKSAQPFNQAFAFNVVGLRPTRATTGAMNK